MTGIFYPLSGGLGNPGKVMMSLEIVDRIVPAFVQQDHQRCQAKRQRKWKGFHQDHHVTSPRGSAFTSGSPSTVWLL
jgi:hypothetical protein